ncbi:hypothetical protein [Nitrospira moscoviensis]|uniref:Uncharacterized protein n=1 Tax=Nitrospira moscoviensis TaxID=42253 RepID=A0A0K2G9G9_NITMO|nr:hypothetical protein [Nitrospira moscoviensis]ALA57585.1 exported protein of unknown function [Nitrospira moscoviensis]
MNNRLALIIVLFLMVVSPQLAACAALTAPYSIKDAGIFAEDADLVWLDNRRVLFHGHKGMEPSSDPKTILRLNDRGLYFWDTISGALELYDTFDTRSDGLLLKSSLCVHDGVLTYVNRGIIISGKRGQEARTPFPKQPYWFNPHSCGYYDTKPFWFVENHRTIPLLEEHGYLDLGTVIPPQPDPLTLRFENPNPAISFYSLAAKKSFTLPMGQLEVGGLRVEFAPYKNVYLISGLQYFDDVKRDVQPAWPDAVPLRVWWLSPDGTLTKQEMPKLPWSHGNAFKFFPARNGVFMSKQSPSGPEAFGSMGGYLIQGQEMKRVVSGALRRVAMSPDGCSVAVVNDMYEKKSVSERARLQHIQLCQGE